jgi:hypothetical protein
MRSSLSLATGLDRAFSILAKRDLLIEDCRYSLWQKRCFRRMGAPVGEVGAAEGRVLRRFRGSRLRLRSAQRC